MPGSVASGTHSTLNYAVTTSIHILPNSLFTAWPLKTGPIDWPETSVHKNQQTTRKNTEWEDLAFIPPFNLTLFQLLAVLSAN